MRRFLSLALSLVLLAGCKGSLLMVCHEPEFYEGLATEVWDCSKWTTRIL